MARAAGNRRGRIRENPLVGLLGNPPTLSRGVERIVYQHAADGKRYGHDFGPDVRAQLNRDGSVTIAHRQGKKLWKRFGEQEFLVNPPKRAKRSSRRAPQRQARRQARKQAAIPQEAERMARKRGRKSARRRSGARRRSRSRAAVVHSNAPRSIARRRGGRIRRNPPSSALFTGRGLIGFGMDAVKIGLSNTAGKTAGRVAADLVKIDKSTPAGMGVQLVTGFGLGLLAEFLLGRGMGAAIASGSVSSIAEQLIKDNNVPYAATALSEWAPSPFPSAFAAYPRRHALPAAVAARPGVNAYPRFAGVPARNQPWAVYSQQ